MIDLTDHLEALKERGELLTVNEPVEPGLEMAALAAMSNRTGAQAIHFKKIAGYPEGYSIAANLFSGPGHYYEYKRTMWGRFAIGLGIDPKMDYESLINAINDRSDNPILPVKVSTGPCKEVIQRGDEVDLFKFPFPFLHKEDGGNYGFGTLITKDPESDWQNWGLYRFMIVGRDRIVADFLSEPSFSTDTKAIYQKYARENKPMPFAIVLGGAPAITIAAAMKLPAGVGEVDCAGGLNLDPINLVDAETSGLLVPGDAEIVIEGEVIPGEMVEEGPYGSIKGYSSRVMRPVMKVSAITHRKELILPIIVDGTKCNDTQVIISLTESARLLRRAKADTELPLRWVQIPPDFNLGLCICSLRNVYHGTGFGFAHDIFSITNLFDKVIITDHDIYPTSLDTVISDWIQKGNPDWGEHFIPGYPPAVMPYYGEIVPGEGTARYYIEAYWPSWYKDEEKPTALTWENCYPKEIQDRVLQRWREEFRFPVEPRPLPKGQR